MPRRAPTCCPAALCTNPRPCPDHPTRWAEGLRGRAMPPGWDATRARILARDPACRLCGAAPSTEVHHLLGPGHEQDHELLGVCHPCHDGETQRQAALARGASAPGDQSPGASAGRPRPDAQGDRHPARRAATWADAGVGGDPSRARSARSGARARAARGRFRPFWSPPVTETPFGQVGALRAPARRTPRVTRHPLRSNPAVTQRGGLPARPAHPAELVTLRAWRPR